MVTTPLSPVSSSSSSSSTTPPTKSKSFWPRELVFGHPHPSQLAGGRQLDTAPMCPCHDCWEYGSHAVALAMRRAAKEEKKQAREAAAAAAVAAAATAAAQESTSSKKNGLGLRFLRWSNPSRASVASDARPLRQSLNLASPPASIYECDDGYDF